jgi:hypothetical protein
MADDDQKVKMIAEEITRYLLGRPEAADTFDGITRWWLARIRIEDASAQVQKALDLLVAGNVIVRTLLPDGNAIYRSARRTEEG